MAEAVTRTESAAATRRVLLDVAAELLACGGPEAVTLREVGARAGVSRGAPYRHFEDKERLLTAVGAEGWERLGDRLHAIGRSGLAPHEALRAGLVDIVSLCRERPHLYRLMFSPPASDPSAMVVAAQRMCDEFLALVVDALGERNAQRYAAVLLTGAHGAGGLEFSGLLTTDKWATSAVELVDSLLDVVMIAVDAGGEA